MLTRGAWLYGSAAVAIVCLLATPARADVTVLGDRSAYEAVAAAFKKLFSLPGFRAKMTSPNGGQGFIEFAQPNSYRIMAQAQGYGFETIHVGDKVATRRNMPGAPPEWQCRTVKPSDKSFIDLVGQRATGTVSVSRGPDTVIDGTPVHTFVSTKESRKDTVYVDVQNGLPKRAINDKDTIDYYDYGEHVVITPPPCAQ